MGNRVGGAGFHAVAAKDAAVVIDVVHAGITLASADADLIGVLLSLDINAAGRAGGGAKEAGHAFLQPVVVALKHVLAPVALLEARRRVRIIVGNGRLQHLLKGDAQALHDGRGGV